MPEQPGLMADQNNDPPAPAVRGHFIRKARVDDVKTIHALLMNSAAKGELLPRPLNTIYSHLRDFYVVSPLEGGPIKGCCALSICWQDLAEIRSLYLSPDMRGQGWGRRLVDACLSEALTLGFYRVFTLTYQDDFFAHLGFTLIGKDKLPHKVWADCINCPKFPECDEIAMIMEM